MDFDYLPDKTIQLMFAQTSYGNTRIDVAEFPLTQGVYVIRFEKIAIPRLSGTSPILYIGLTQRMSFQSRFNSYNGKNWFTQSALSLCEVMTQQDNGRTEAFVLCSLLKQVQRGPILIDLYFNPPDSEHHDTEFLYKYLALHDELPPLNRALGKLKPQCV